MVQIMKYCYFAVVLLLLALVSGCRASPAPTPPSLPEPTQELLDAVPFAAPKEGPTEAWREARSLFFAAYVLQLQGQLEEAIKQYQSSIDTFPTAEAYTFLGWTYSWMGRYDDAIREAQCAITLDPEYGNPYNDIGVYLTEQGKLDEAIPWLMQAIEAKRYASPHYPRLNLGHIWILKGEWGKALSSYEEIWRLAPDYPIPDIPALAADLYLPPEQARNPGTVAEQQAVMEAVAQYFQAWNNYDADALKGFSAPPDNEVSMALLLHLAAAKRAGVTIAIHDIEVLHLEGNIAIVAVSVSPVDEPKPIYQLLRRINGTWKVVVRLFLTDHSFGTL
ncbi:MAG: tetratricopeptide repeat protein [Dehalococcoidales bacterium]|nr:tetratricopeptide repeat protein [Dehalococcoidales bacterium]